MSKFIPRAAVAAEQHRQMIRRAKKEADRKKQEEANKGQEPITKGVTHGVNNT